MSSIIDHQYIGYVGPRLEGFKWIRTNLALSRCPICGDSSKKQSKKRLYIYQDLKHGTYRYNVHCKNCGHSESFYSFLKNFAPDLFEQYRLELFKELGFKPRASEKPQEALQEPICAQPIPTYSDTPLSAYKTILELPDGHFCKEYVRKRMIPEKHWGVLYYCENFKGLVTDVFPENDSIEKMPEDARLVIPFFNEWKELICMQGRSLDPSSKMRYITVKKDESVQKVFGKDRIKKDKPIYVVEGPIDSLFIDNCLASADADLLSVKIGNIFCFDFQYRNREICRRISDAIDKGVSVILLPESKISKDVNELITNGEIAQDELMTYLEKNIYKGLSAKLRFSQLKKC